MQIFSLKKTYDLELLQKPNTREKNCTPSINRETKTGTFKGVLQFTNFAVNINIRRLFVPLIPDQPFLL